MLVVAAAACCLLVLLLLLAVCSVHAPHAAPLKPLADHCCGAEVLLAAPLCVCVCYYSLLLWTCTCRWPTPCAPMICMPYGPL